MLPFRSATRKAQAPLIVVDASALTDFLLGRRPAMTAIAEATRGRGEQSLHAPELVEPVLSPATNGALVGLLGQTSGLANQAVKDALSGRPLSGPERTALSALMNNLAAKNPMAAALRHWNIDDGIPFEQMISNRDGNQLHQNDWSYDCIAQALANAIVDAARPRTA